MALRLAMVSSGDSPLDAEDNQVGSISARRCCDFKGCGVGSILEEQVEHTSRISGLFTSRSLTDTNGGGVQNLRQDGFRQSFDRQQMDQLTVLLSCDFVGKARGAL
jgi:hypothetical protein